HDEQLTVVGLLDVVNDADAGVIRGGGGLGLAAESLLGAFVVAPLRRKELERHRPPELRVPGAIHHAHATAAALGADFVLGNGAPNQGVAWAFVQRGRSLTRDSAARLLLGMIVVSTAKYFGGLRL